MHRAERPPEITPPARSQQHTTESQQDLPYSVTELYGALLHDARRCARVGWEGQLQNLKTPRRVAAMTDRKHASFCEIVTILSLQRT